MQEQMSDWLEDEPIKYHRDYYCLLTYNTDGTKDEALFDTDAEARAAATPMTRWGTSSIGKPGQFGYDESTGQRFRIAVDWMTSTLTVPEGHHIERHFTPGGWFIARVVADE